MQLLLVPVNISNSTPISWLPPPTTVRMTLVPPPMDLNGALLSTPRSPITEPPLTLRPSTVLPEEPNAPGS